MSPAWIRPRPVKVSPRNPRGKTYQVLYRRGGRGSPIVAAGTFKTEREAKLRRDLVGGWLAAGLNPKDELARLETAPATVRKLSDWADAYLASRVDYSGESAISARSHVRRIVKTLGDRDALTLTPADVQEWIAANSTLKASSLRPYLRTLMLILDYAAVDPNPARSPLVRLPAVVREQQTAPTADQLERILLATAERSQLPLATLEQTAMRVGELVSLAWGDVDETGNRFRLRSAEVKTRSSRWVQVPAWLMTVIANTLPREDRTPERRVFPRVNETSLWREMTAACKSAGVPHFTPHDLRHRRATIWHHDGVPLRVLMERGGWTSSEVAIETYSHSMPVDELPQARLQAILVRPR